MALYAKIKSAVKYTVIGNPTIQNDIISDFSSTDYIGVTDTLSLTSNDTVELIIDLNFNTVDNTEGFAFFSYTGRNFQFYHNSNTNYWYLNINSQEALGTKKFYCNIDYKIKAVITTSNISFYYYENNQWNLDISYSVETTQLASICFGDNYTHNSTRVFPGSINFNNTIIKKNEMVWFGNSSDGYFSKVKLHSPSALSYTLKGSPTITSDGVASGFTDKNDYLILGAFNPGTHKWRFTTKVKFNSLTANMSLIDRNSSTRCFQIAMRTNGKWRVNISINGSSKANEVDGTHVCTVDTIYYLRFEYDGSKYYLKISTDNINWTTDITINRADKIYPVSTMCMGHSWYNSGTEKWDGDIYMRYTRFEIDGVTNDKCILHCLEGN